MSMWENLRKKYTDYSKSDVAKIYGCSRQAINEFEKGKSMPKKLQIIYLGFRNNKTDKFNIKYLEELINK